MVLLGVSCETLNLFEGGVLTRPPKYQNTLKNVGEYPNTKNISANNAHGPKGPGAIARKHSS